MSSIRHRVLLLGAGLLLIFAAAVSLLVLLGGKTSQGHLAVAGYPMLRQGLTVSSDQRLSYYPLLIPGQKSFAFARRDLTSGQVSKLPIAMAANDTHFSVSADGRFIAFAQAEGRAALAARICVFNTVASSTICLHGQADNASDTQLAFSPDSGWLAVAAAIGHGRALQIVLYNISDFERPVQRYRVSYRAKARSGDRFPVVQIGWTATPERLLVLAQQSGAGIPREEMVGLLADPSRGMVIRFPATGVKDQLKGKRQKSRADMQKAEALLGSYHDSAFVILSHRSLYLLDQSGKLLPFPQGYCRTGCLYQGSFTFSDGRYTTIASGHSCQTVGVTAPAPFLRLADRWVGWQRQGQGAEELVRPLDLGSCKPVTLILASPLLAAG